MTRVLFCLLFHGLNPDPRRRSGSGSDWVSCSRGSRERYGGMNDMCWPLLLLLLCCAAEFEAQQPGERSSDFTAATLVSWKKLALLFFFFLTKEKSGVLCLFSTCLLVLCWRLCTTVLRVWRWDYFMCLSLCLRVRWQGFFEAVDERVWSALLVKTRESSLDLRFLLYQPDQDEIPVSSSPSLFFIFFKFQINLSKSFPALQKRAALLSAAAAAAVELHRLRSSSTCLITAWKNTLNPTKCLFLLAGSVWSRSPWRWDLRTE